LSDLCPSTALCLSLAAAPEEKRRKKEKKKRGAVRHLRFMPKFCAVSSTGCGILTKPNSLSKTWVSLIENQVYVYLICRLN